MAAKDNLSDHFNAGSGRTLAEQEYGEGKRIIPPQMGEMSGRSQAAVAAGYQNSTSNLKTREQGARDTNKGDKIPQGSVDRLTDKTVGITEAAGHVAGSWEKMMASPDKPDPAWYFGHNRRLQRTADESGIPVDRVIDSSAGMSPQNGPDGEFRAATAMADAVTNKRRITAVNDVDSVVSAAEKKKGVQPYRVMDKGATRQLTSMDPQDMQHATSAANSENIKAAPGVDIDGFRHSGTNRIGGFETMKGTANAVEEMESAKVPLYAEAIRQAKPDTPLHAEYEARFGDQMASRNDRLFKENGGSGLKGGMDRVDQYGLMKGGDDPSDPAYHHGVLGTKGYAVPDTWMLGILSGQELHDTKDAPSPGKMANSRTPSTSATGIADNTFPKPAEAASMGGKKFTGTAAVGMAALEAVQQGAVQARESGSQTNIPPVMLQEMTWTHERAEVGRSAQELQKDPTVKNRGKLGSRVSKMFSGGLEGEKEFRPQQGPQGPRGNIETAGAFHRGNNDPLLADEGITVMPRRGGNSSPRGRSPEMDSFHANAAQQPPQEQGSPTSLAKRRAIKDAIASQNAERATRGITDHPGLSRG